MIGLVALVGMAAIAVTTTRHLWLPVSLATAVLVLLPQVAAPVVGLPFVGGLNVGTAFLAVIATVQLAGRTRVYLTDVVESFPIYALLGVFLVCMTMTSLATGTTAQQQYLGDATIGSVLMFTLVRRAIADDPLAARRIVAAFLAAAVACAGLALLVWAGALEQPFAAEYSKTYYWFVDGYDRALGTADSPLNLGVVMTIATALLMGIRRVWLVVGCAALFLATVFATESRTALVLCVLALIVIMVRRRVPFVAFASLALAASTAIVVAIVALPDLTSGLIDKLGDDAGSGNARSIGLAQGLPAMLDFPFLGGGPASAVDVARRLGLGTSFENPVIMLALNWGMLGTVCFFTAQALTIALPSRRPRVVPGGRLAGACAVLAILTFSSIAFVSGLDALTWMALALASPPIGGRTIGRARFASAALRGGDVSNDASVAPSSTTTSGHDVRTPVGA